MKDIFLSTAQKENLSKWKSKNVDISLSSKILGYLWDLMIKFIPSDIAPNVLSFMGLLCNLHAFYLCYLYIDDHPKEVSITAVVLMSLSYAFDSLDGRQARKIKNESPLGELFGDACINIGVIFSILSLCYIIGIRDIMTQWYFGQTAALFIVATHIEALGTKIKSFGRFTGPGEPFMIYAFIVITKTTIGLDWIVNKFNFTLVPMLESISGTKDSIVLLRLISKVIYYSTVILVIISLMFVQDHSATKKNLIFCFFYRNVIPILLSLGWMNISKMDLSDIMCDGLFFSIVSTDLVVSKMSGRDLHPWISLFAMISIFNHFFILVIVAFYYVLLFWDVCTYLHLPMFTTYINVYVDGVYDMLHFGHQKAFQAALQFGSRLIVGVLSDENVMSYKRRPIMSLKERADSVRVCKGVDQVIEDSPLISDEKFLKDNNIHVVAHSTEYDTKDDRYYVVPRRLGMTRVLPRTEGISTSDLIKRVHEWYEENKKNGNNSK
eukprot:TRINITY_DN2783_c0_g1_i1.p1 TRINITY_DN2783_c0_g1~~TRINITY_DN2783_c0_g1_i1.p1  ORF type:complete len:494 (-),score=88.83 TRINITY_DN2783_c0_g1_i1:135-1616(-)